MATELPDKRLEEIKQRQHNRKSSKWDSHGRSMIADIDYLVSLLQQPTTSERCVKCGHQGWLNADGICQWIPGLETVYEQPCGCKCVYPATGADEGEETDLHLAISDLLLRKNASYSTDKEVTTSPAAIAPASPQDETTPTATCPNCGWYLSADIGFTEAFCERCDFNRPIRSEPTSTSEPSIEAAREVMEQLKKGYGTGYQFTSKCEEDIAAIISRHIPDAGARKYFCSCGAACTAEEYIEHYFEKGHDRRAQLVIDKKEGEDGR